VTANIAGRDQRGVFEEVRAKIDKEIDPPVGIRIEYAGLFER
jgi:Cu(I)/Ag(I) efflux system membrane protein CusA/SilA